MLNLIVLSILILDNIRITAEQHTSAELKMAVGTGCSAPICNPCPDLKSLCPDSKNLPRFEISLPRFEKPAPICNLFASI